MNSGTPLRDFAARCDDLRNSRRTVAGITALAGIVLLIATATRRRGRRMSDS
jgi:hypothetical protein